MLDRLHCVIMEKDGGKVVVLVDGNAPVGKCSIVEGAFGKSSFVELNDRAYSADVAPCDCYLLPNLFVVRILVAMMKESMLLMSI